MVLILLNTDQALPKSSLLTCALSLSPTQTVKILCLTDGGGSFINSN